MIKEPGQPHHFPHYKCTAGHCFVVSVCRELSHNQIKDLPSFYDCSALQEMWAFKDTYRCVYSDVNISLSLSLCVCVSPSLSLSLAPIFLFFSTLCMDLCCSTSRQRFMYTRVEVFLCMFVWLCVFYVCSGLQHNQIRRIESSTFQQLVSLRALWVNVLRFNDTMYVFTFSGFIFHLCLM